MSAARPITIDTPVGPMVAAASSAGVTLFEFGEGRHVERKIAGLADAPSDDDLLDRLVAEVKAYFAGDLRQFTVPMATVGTPFQQSVWNALCDIPFGQTRSYAQQAVAVGNLKAIRAVAQANGQNCRAIIIPCHRVIGSNGSLTGFGGGLPTKRWLIDHERAVAGNGDLFAAPLPAVAAAG